ncbi:MAG: hypothetical protein IPG21_06665 [Saprospiraceae bacterium]|nr:hypothetical protein [Candidatus Vicinibacter affinis]
MGFYWRAITLKCPYTIGGNVSVGFGGFTILDGNNIVNWIASVEHTGNHGIFCGPYIPVGNNFDACPGGTLYGSEILVPTGSTVLLKETGTSRIALAGISFGIGSVIVGGMLPSGYHCPYDNLSARHLKWNILSYLKSPGSLIALNPSDTSVCPGQTGSGYSIQNNCGAWTFSFPNGGGVISFTTSNSVIVNWGQTPGIYYVKATDGITVLFRKVIIEGNLALACDDLVNVSLNDRCEALITPSVVIEGSSYPDDSYTVTVYNTDGSIIPGNLVNKSHLGKKLRVLVRHICSGITCWGYIFIEDKFIPNLTCRAADITVNCSDDVRPSKLGILRFPLPPTATVIPVVGDNKCFTVTGFDLCCDVELCYFDIYTKYGCNQPNYAQYDRTWVAKDCKGKYNYLQGKNFG